MSTLRAVVFTRPYPIGLGDYTFFVRPAEFAKDRNYFDSHIRNVLHEDDSGAIGSIRGRRWHVLRRGGLVVVGMATNEFRRRDEAGRPIRGYYGFAMPANDVGLPSESLFRELDKRCVEPAFMQASVKTEDSDLLSGGLFDDPVQYAAASDSRKWQFNTCAGRIRFHCCKDICDILSSALVAASRNPEFEIAIGLNTVEHAKRLPILNCVCHAVTVPEEIQLPQPAGFRTGSSSMPQDPAPECAFAEIAQGQRESRASEGFPGGGRILGAGSSRKFMPGKKQSFWEKLFRWHGKRPAGPSRLDGPEHFKAVVTKGSARNFLEQGFGRKDGVRTILDGTRDESNARRFGK